MRWKRSTQRRAGKRRGASRMLRLVRSRKSSRASTDGKPYRACLGGRAECFDLPLDGEALERDALDLAHPLAREAEAAPDLLERGRLHIAVQSVAHPDDVAFPRGKLGYRPAQGVHAEADR